MSRKSPQVLQILPKDTIVFEPPFNVASSATLSVTNPTEGIVAFKIKTTAPKRYCVRPNAGLLQPAGYQEIKITLQPGPTDERHKFMVQTLIVDESYEELNKDEQSQLWKDQAKAMMSSKLLCEFKLDDIAEIEPDTVEQPTVVSEPVFQHQQNIEPIKPKIAEKVQFKLDEPVAKEPQISTLPNLAEKPVLQNSGNKQAAEEIKQLKARLADALKQIEILSSSSPEPEPEKFKSMAILLAVAFIAGFILSSLL